MKQILWLIILSSLLSAFGITQANEEYPVKLTKNLPFVVVPHEGKNIVIKRIQNTDNRLVDDFTKTSRPCPPFCIHPMKAAEGVETIGELELINFLQNQSKAGTGILIDARMPSFFESETIPGAINVPFILFTGNNSDKILEILGATIKNGKKDFSKVKELCFFCNGPWCDQSPRAIKALVKKGYPANKLKYYRGGMQLWKNFGLTTVLPKSNLIDEEVKNNVQ